MKSNILLSVFQDDAEYFKSIQQQYKSEGKTAALLFKEIIQIFKESKKNNAWFFLFMLMIKTHEHNI